MTNTQAGQPVTIETPHLRLIPFDRVSLEALLSGQTSFLLDGETIYLASGHDLFSGEFHAAAERMLASGDADSGQRIWRLRAVVSQVSQGSVMVGHVGFHYPPKPVEDALDDPTYIGPTPPADGLATEIGYTIFPAFQRHGLATEAAAGLVEWAFENPLLGAILATAEVGNVASIKVLERLNFIKIGTCRDGESMEIVFLLDNKAPHRIRN